MSFLLRWQLIFHTLKSLASAASDNVEGYDFTKKNLFTESAKGIKVNKDALSQLLEVQHKAKSTDFSDAIDKQTKAIQDQNKAVEKAKNTESYDTEKAKLQDMFDDLAKIRQARSQYNALYQQQQEALTDYADWVNAQSTENAGDKYTNMVTGLKNAKELYNKGLVGTDDFKSFAKMISPTGATDVANFEENYNKAKRYLTDNDKGVKNFLNDLKSKGLATYSDSEGWNIGDIDLKRDSRAMGIGKDFMSNMFGRLEDYGFHNNVFSTTEEGVQKLSEAYKNLFDSQSRVKDLEKNDSGNATAIQGAKDDVEAYKADIEQIKNGFSNVTEDTADQYSAEIDAAHDQAEFLEKQREEVLLDKDGKYGDKAKQIASMMEADIDELKSKYEDSLDDIDVKTEKQIKKEAKDKENANKDATSDNPSTPDFGNDEQSKKTYDDVFKQIKDAKDNNDRDVQQAIDTLSNFTADQVNGVDLFDGKYDSDELKPAEQALDSLKEKFQLTDEQAQMLGKVFESMGVLKPETDTSDVDKVKDDAKEAVDDLNEITGKQYKIDFDTTDPDKIQQQLNEISSEVDKHVTTDSEGNPHYDESQEGAVEAEKAYKAEVQHQQQNEYETSAMGQYESDNNLVQAMQNFMQATDAAHVQIDVTGKFTGVSAQATQLETSRNIFGKSFNGTGDVAGKGLFYGHKTDAGERFCNSAIEIRENDLVSNSQSDFVYAPSIGFHWSNRVAGFMALHSDANFYFRKQNGTDRATIDANLNAGSISTTTANIYGTATFTNMSIHNGGVKSGLLHLQGTTSASIDYGANNPKIKFVNSDGSQIIELMYTDYDSVRNPAGLAMRGNQGNEYFDVPHLYANQVHVDNHCALQYDSSNQCLNFVFS